MEYWLESIHFNAALRDSGIYPGQKKEVLEL